MNLLAYAQKHLHDTPAERELTHVDVCLLNELAYLPLDVIAEHHGGFAYGVGAAQIYQEFSSDGTLRANWFLATAQRLQLLKLVAASARFAGLKFCRYEAKQDDAEQVQFAALTLVLPGVLKQVIFRGTDDTLTGWKEDFHLAARQRIPAQALAADYLSEALACDSRLPLFVTGHSKGGHLAVYAASVQGEQAQARIDELVTFDSPGFVPEFLGQPGYQGICAKTVDYIPVDSIVGRLMFKRGTPQVVASSFFGLMQHSIFNWHTDARGHFALVERPTPASDRVKLVSRAWLDRHSPEEVQEVVDVCFSLAMDEGYTSLLGIGQNIVPFIQRMRAKAQELDPETYRMVQGALDDFLVLWRRTRSQQRQAGGGVLKLARPLAFPAVQVGGRGLVSFLSAERSGRLP
ncbi:Mbeg1-like protein [Rothia sp. 88186D007BW]